MQRTISMICPACQGPEPIVIEIARDEEDGCYGWGVADYGACPTCGAPPLRYVRMRLCYEAEMHGAEWEAEDAYSRVEDAAWEGRRAYRRALADYRRVYGQ